MTRRDYPRLRLRQEEGFTLTELLITMTVMLVMLSAVLTVFEAFMANAKQSEETSDAQDKVRMETDRLAKELRNLASPAQGGAAIEKAAPYDLIFRTVDRLGPNTGANKSNVRRLRYCVRDNGKWHKQWQTWTTALPPAMPANTDCPGTGWTGSSELSRLENVNGDGARPLFQFDSTDLSAITGVRTDATVKASAKQIRLRTGVALRNQNRQPTASFSATPGGSRLVLLNGSASSDPDGQPLEFLWYVDGVTEPIARGPMVQWTAPTAGVNRTFRLKVIDPGELYHEAAGQTVTIS